MQKGKNKNVYLNHGRSSRGMDRTYKTFWIHHSWPVWTIWSERPGQEESAPEGMGHHLLLYGIESSTHRRRKWPIIRRPSIGLQRFTALGGHPRKMWSDPGKNFVGAKPAGSTMHIWTGKAGKWSQQNSPHRNGAAEAAVHSENSAGPCWRWWNLHKHFSSWQLTWLMRDQLMPELKAGRTVLSISAQTLLCLWGLGRKVT